MRRYNLVCTGCRVGKPLLAAGAGAAAGAAIPVVAVVAPHALAVAPHVIAGLANSAIDAALPAPLGAIDRASDSVIDILLNLFN